MKSILRFFASTLTFTRIINAQVDLGTASSFAVLGGEAVTNTGFSRIYGDVGVSPGLAITGFPPGVITNGITHAADAVAAQAQSDITTAYNAAAKEPSHVDLTGQDLGGMTLVAGVYTFSSSAQLTGPLTLDGQGDSGSVWIFQIGSTLTTASAAHVLLIDGASSCNVFWQVGSSATIGTATVFVGNILALTSITFTTGASSQGGLYARNVNDDARHDFTWHDFIRHDFIRHDFIRYDFAWHDFNWHDFNWHDFTGHDFTGHDFNKPDLDKPDLDKPDFNDHNFNNHKFNNKHEFNEHDFDKLINLWHHKSYNHSHHRGYNEPDIPHSGFDAVFNHEENRCYHQERPNFSWDHGISHYRFGNEINSDCIKADEGVFNGP
ncbi:hypothetical protein LEL_05018 [Akanthomyces lecanii RCEF 1005]|uniref:Outer membrane autotransporter barrel n=1 Tax=Akanthomyces lecanii RCEF 1005 TaxID=1081108 RepID=A0A162IU77_CORDF|nr:hypothetical protein LEL_05018 [Akanthomyces lecanii RCEF 1005]